MNVRFSLFILSCFAWLILANLVSPSLVLVRNTAAVASVQNSDSAFFAQRALENSLSGPRDYLALLCITAAFWVPVYLKKNRTAATK